MKSEIDPSQKLADQAKTSTVLSELRAALGDSLQVDMAQADLQRHLHDSSGLTWYASPLAVALPRSTQDVAATLKICSNAGIPVVPQGGLTGMVGGALPVDGAVLLSLQRMTRIEEVDAASATMLVQAGAPLQRVQQAAEEHGLSFPLDLGARGSCMIGGNIATNAGGNRVLRFGMARDLVLGLEVVLADGTIVSSLNKMIKNNAGYDLKHLFIGSEGTLGVITRAVLRLVPAAASSAVALCAAGNYEAVLELLKLARSRLSGSLSAFEVMWKEFYALALASRSRPVPVAADHEIYVLLEALLADENAGARDLESLLEDAYAGGIILDATIGKSNAECADLWAIRDFSGELDRYFGRAVNFDVSIPVGQIAEFVTDCRRRLDAKLPGARMLVFGHIADSNIHLACRAAGNVLPRDEIDRVIYQCVGDWRGSISAEHGIGVAKREWLSATRSAAEIALMRSVKSALDPKNILNPGKVLPE